MSVKYFQERRNILASAPKKKSGKKTVRAKKPMILRPTLRQRMASLFKWTILALITIIVLPFALTVLYRWEAIHPTSTLMISRHLAFKPVDRRWIELDDMAPAAYQAVMMSEDGQFCAHSGSDWNALNLVISDAIDGEKTRGASTITMQTAKNLFLWGGRSYVRKALEIPLALWIELVLPKKRIMEIYLNIAEWDDNGVFGIEAGSQSHFGVSAANLSRKQAAYMAVTLPNPILREPSKPTNGLRRLASVNIKRAQNSGAYIKCLQ